MQLSDLRAYLRPNLSLVNLRGDLLGGLTAGIVALPLALAFGVSSGLGAEAGLYGAIIVGMLAALFGGTPAQVSGPTGPMTVVTAGLVAAFSGRIELVLAIFVLAGLFQILMGVFRLGNYIRFVPYPVVSGFMSGIGVIIILLQLNPLLGQPSQSQLIKVLTHLGETLAGTDLKALGLGLATLAIIYGFPRLTRAVPSTLVALLAGSLAAALLQLDVPVIGQIPVGLPGFHFALPGLEDLPLILVPALTLAALGSIDSLLTSLVADKLTRTRHDSNRELVGQGLGNLLAGCFGGLPGAGATMRTVVNIRSGGQTGLSGASHSLVLLLILLALSPLASRIPLAVLAGILISVGIGIIDYKGIRSTRYIPKADTFVMLSVLGLTVFVDLIQAVAVGMVLSSLLYLKKSSQHLEAQAQPQAVADAAEGQLYVQALEGPLFFGMALPFQSMLAKLPDLGRVVLMMERVPFIDQSGLFALEEVAHYLKDKGVPLVLIGVQPQPLRLLRRAGIVPGLISEDRTFSSDEAGQDWLQAQLRQELVQQET